MYFCDQVAIDELVSAYPMGRAFTRPSGTEDAVRVYAEAESKDAADALALAVAQALYDHAGKWTHTFCVTPV